LQFDFDVKHLELPSLDKISGEVAAPWASVDRAIGFEHFPAFGASAFCRQLIDDQRSALRACIGCHDIPTESKRFWNHAGLRANLQAHREDLSGPALMRTLDGNIKSLSNDADFVHGPRCLQLTCRVRVSIRGGKTRSQAVFQM
jgi:hypothetical protein